MIGNRSTRRVALFASAATMSLAFANAAYAAGQQQGTGPQASYLEPQSAPPEASYVSPQAVPESSILEPQVVISQPGTPTTAQDPNDVTGIGEMIIDQQNGYIGLCTGTLINPRTVIFASHCVNENPDETAFQDPWGYGAANGGLPIAFGFHQNNNAAGNSAFGNWLYGGYQTDVSNYLYNVNQVTYNPASTQLGLGNNFLQGDVAIATLDTPAANVPTWALLFSQLPAPGSIDPATGTGYHVTITGYGDTGTGNIGDNGAGVDFRRRVAENYIGILGSLDDLDGYLFGVDDGLPQNLYQLDFDDPRRGTLNASIYDFNVFRDDALPNEGITAPGDSGGPLILDDTFDQKLVIGVLSGGDRFYGAQNSASYGTTSFYQPLYLFWDWIAANNNYHYVGAKAGDGNWSDPTHWVSNIDPSYMTIDSTGNLVNGIPQYAGDGINGTSGKFGEICDEGTGFSDCYNLTTGLETYVHNGQTDYYQHDPASGDPLQIALANPTLDNGLPGATNFVPNDRDPDAATHTRAAYFDVTLAAAGTTTLDTDVTVDRLTIAGTSSTKLHVTDSGALSSLIDITQLDGLMNVDGTVSSVGDYLLMAGGISGHGRINAPYLTSLTGMIAPGGPGTIGTLTIGGNLILSSGNVLLIDLGTGSVSDKLSVVANQHDGEGNPVDGLASLGGTVLFSPANGATVKAGNHYTFLTAENGFVPDEDGNVENFNTAPLSAILTPHLSYTDNAVSVTIDAGNYADVVADTPVQNAYAQLLDQNRPVQDQFSKLYIPLDMQNAATIQASLEALAPRTEALNQSLATAAIDNMDRFNRDRLTSLKPGHLGGDLALMGQPLQMASLRMSDMPGGSMVQSDTSTAVVEHGRLPSTMSGFLAGGYINGDSAAMPTAIPFAGRDQFDGFYIAGGLEKEIGEHAIVGLSTSYTQLTGHTGIAGQTARSTLGTFSVYTKIQGGGGFAFDAIGTIGGLGSSTDRLASIIGTTYKLHTKSSSLVLSGEIGVGDTVDLGQFKLTPRASLRATHIDFDPVNENGSGPALRYDRDNLDSIQGRLGANLAGGGKVRPYLSAYYVHDFKDRPAVFGANFVGGIGPDALFALPGEDHDWGEVGGGISFGGPRVQLSVSADTTVWRSDVANQSYRATLKFHF